MLDKCNTLIVGGGLAGMILGSRLAQWGQKVWIVEKEEYSPAHTSWRALNAWNSAEAWDEDVAQLSRAGSALWNEAGDVLTSKGWLQLFDSAALTQASAMWARGIRAATGIEQLEPWEAAKKFPWLKIDSTDIAAALWIPPGAAGMIDAGRIYSHFRRRFYEQSGSILLSESFLDARSGGGAWTVRTSKGALRADTVVNCAGAWAGEVALRCGVRGPALHSTKRAMMSLPLTGSAELPWRNGPLVSWNSGLAAAVCNVRSGWADLSPAGEAEWASGAIEPEGWQIAEALRTLDTRTWLRLDEGRATSKAWLRTRVPDGRPLIGWSDVPGYFSMTGFGETGPECALSASAIAADMISGRSDFRWLTDQYGLRMGRFAPDRWNNARVTA